MQIIYLQDIFLCNLQVELHTDLEAKLPWKVIDMVDKSEYKYYPNKCAGYIESVSDEINESE